VVKQRKLLFIGDSITEWGKSCFDDLGTGYVRMVHDELCEKYLDKHIHIVNRGVGGDRVTDLEKRWERDVLEENPAYLSVSIGINDVWRQLDGLEEEQVYPQKFEQVYRSLLEQVKERTEAQIVLMEPSIIEENVYSEGNQRLAEYVKIIQQLAHEYDAICVPIHHVFLNHLRMSPDQFVTTDGVHMNERGNELMAKTWVESFTKHLDS